MSNIDWSKAPEGATHAVIWSGSEHTPHVWYVLKGNNSKFLYEKARVAGGGWKALREAPSHHPLIPRPAAWSGQGLPPVGVVCEVASRYAHGGDRVRIVAHDDGEAVGRYMSGELIGSYTSFVEGELVPIRTPEQIAAEEREAAINELVRRFAINGHFDWYELFSQMYDAGVFNVKE